MKSLDWRGDLTATATEQGQTTAAPVSDAFGDLVNGTPDVYTWNGGWGYRHEAKTGGLQKVGVRWYDSTVGRFLQKDPWLGSIGYPLTLNAYGYCVNDPVGFVDPTGWQKYYIEHDITISYKVEMPGKPSTGSRKEHFWSPREPLPEVKRRLKKGDVVKVDQTTEFSVDIPFIGKIRVSITIQGNETIWKDPKAK